jgi:acetoin utilization protein AcuB
MSRVRRPIREYMTPLPHSVGVDTSISEVLERMATLGVRHLPVLAEGELVGVVDLHRLGMLRTLANVDCDRASVEDCMLAEPFVVGPDMPLDAVARQMAQRKAGCVLVVEDHSVIGLMTTTDALALLADFVGAGDSARPRGPTPREVRERVLDEHEVLRQMLDRVADLAVQVLDDEDALEGSSGLRWNARELYQTLLRHIDLEDALLAPVLRAANDEVGQQRAAALEAEHRAQRVQLRSMLSTLDDGLVADAHLARSIQALVPFVRKDMQHEERELLDGLLVDDPDVSTPK